ncbi:transcriptional regulator [Azorhizobium oxalatiphilum]|uniref:Transcriptional regulator n=1 Tax=Azorhizobium oxalatiphilum TaxID=980631 RepID=A0A917CAL0_9HYPH|nr:helix-turn-helix domain-containing protein [Azorhizobium oxalatiphilum]GGF79616.1 transcriptional regulator [Azorhizobium oxalatiphilum]
MSTAASAIAHIASIPPQAYAHAMPSGRWSEIAKGTASMSLNGEAASPAQVVAALGTPVSFSRNSEIFGDDQLAEHVYVVTTGVVRICKLMGDGRRQIETFCLPGDAFGWETGDRYRFSAEAVSECRLVRVKRSVLFSRAGAEPELACALWALSFAELQRAQEHLLLLGRKTAQERVGSFLLDLARRAGTTTASNVTELQLAMSRQDMADFLGLTIETVSRTLTCLEEQGTISLPSSRRVQLRDRSALRRLDS